MIPLALAEVADAVGGAMHGCDGAGVVFGSVEFDSRRVGPGGLFVALPGEQVDGHDFAAAAMAAGAVGVLAGRPVGVALAAQDGPVAEHRAPDADTPGTRGRHAGRAAPVLVPDVLAALEVLRSELVPGDVVLVKASRAFGLERVAEGLLCAAGPTGGSSIR